jgi:ribosomal protein S18 acetylase RimI-like enzyme
MTTTANPSLDLKNIIISPLNGEHGLLHFSCGERQLDRFISKKTHKYHSTNRLKAFCAHPRDSNNVYGLYTLTMKIEETNKLLKNEQDYVSDRHFPAIYIGTLAVLSRYQNSGLGTILLINALRRAYYVSQNVSVFGVALRSLNERTTKLYQRYGFGLRDDSATPLMVLPIWSLNELIDVAPKSGPRQLP